MGKTSSEHDRKALASLTWDEIAQDTQRGRITDPLVGDYLTEMSQLCTRLTNNSGANLADVYEATLDLCRCTQRLRLDVGKLGFLDSFSRSKIHDVLDQSLAEILPYQAAVEASLDAAARELFGAAIKNIRRRQDELVLESQEQASVNSPK